MNKLIADMIVKAQTEAEKECTVNAINTLSNSNRKIVQGLIGNATAPRNLYFNYGTQNWII